MGNMDFQEMISVGEAEKAIEKYLPRYAPVTLPLSRCTGRILAEPILADRAQPPFHRVAMDGIAISFAAYTKGRRRFRVEGKQMAGEAARTLDSEEGCFEAMTGAVLPLGTDCIIPVEELSVVDGFATHVESSGTKSSTSKAPPAAYRNVHRAGSDCSVGAVIVPAGTRLTAPHLGAAAAFGFSTLPVSALPVASVIATGDELVPPNQEPLPYQIRKSNPYAAEAGLRRIGIESVTLYHARDDQDLLRETIVTALEKCDVLILSGGVSMGQADYVPSVLKGLGVTAVFHKIRQKPGKPFWFGITKSGVPVFALPGNPASLLMCLHRYVLPALWRAMGGSLQGPVGFFEEVVLGEEFSASPKLTQFQPVRVTEIGKGIRSVRKVGNQGSGDFSAWAVADGFVETPPGPSLLAGTYVRFWRW